jgi:hypothetical protein
MLFLLLMQSSPLPRHRFLWCWGSCWLPLQLRCETDFTFTIWNPKQNTQILRLIRIACTIVKLFSDLQKRRHLACMKRTVARTVLRPVQHLAISQLFYVPFLHNALLWDIGKTYIWTNKIYIDGITSSENYASQYAYRCNVVHWRTIIYVYAYM